MMTFALTQTAFGVFIPSMMTFALQQTSFSGIHTLYDVLFFATN
jgi:hypothetical protein